MLRGIDSRITATLQACGIPPGAVAPLTPPPVLADPDPLRLRHGVRFEVPPGTNLFAAAGELWRRGGCQVSETYTGYGSALVAQDAQGFQLVLASGPPAVLVVASPPAPRRDYGLGAGIGIGAVLGPLGSCLSFSGLYNSAGSGNVIGLWAWLPLLLVVGGLLLISPSTRKFGTGLLIGGAITGIALSGVCSLMATAS